MDYNSLLKTERIVTTLNRCSLSLSRFKIYLLEGHPPPCNRFVKPLPSVIKMSGNFTLGHEGA